MRGASGKRKGRRVVRITGSVVHRRNCSFHCLTLMVLMHSMMVAFLTVEAAVTPVRVFPAPQGRTMIPERARPLPNILDRDFSWYTCTIK